MLFGRGVVELLSEVKKPMIFFPAMGDGEGYNADGEWFGALLTKNPTSVTTSDEFRQFNHGFVPRGPDEPAVKEAIVKLFDKYFAFVASHT